LLVNADALERLKRGESAGDILASSSQALAKFQAARARVLLYR
jgi:hypothetical protein